MDALLTSNAPITTMKIIIKSILPLSIPKSAEGEKTNIINMAFEIEFFNLE